MLDRLLRPTLALLVATSLFGLAGCGGGSEESPNDPSGNATTPEKTGTQETHSPTTSAEPEVPEPPAPDHPRTAVGVSSPDGYLVETLYATDNADEGSWVALCAGPDGTLYASAQYRLYKDGDENKARQTLFQIKPPAVDDHTSRAEVVPQPVQINGAQGLCYAFGALYVMETGDSAGLTRVTDSDGDGLLDKKELVLNVGGGGEHGTHAIVPTPDGEALYIIAGNMTPLPELDASRPVQGLWDEDHVLPQNPDGNGHAANVMAPGGWICRVDPDGGNVTLISAGFRNAYDVGVHPNGELFTYDSDMEWDLGQPWYRPTRIKHAVSGAEFGWRNGSGKWPAYYEDSLPGAIDIGPGSPVGVLFGTDAAFPTKYRSAFFALDWTYGIIYAVHLKPDGASYTGEIEPFVMGKPLPVTDAVIADDGHLYFTTGGRRGDSALYRVSYYGNKDTSAPVVEPLTDLAKLRQELEALHTPDAPADALDLIWTNLDHDDRFIRFAARVALEHQPIDRYLDKAKAEADTMKRIVAGLALARHRHPDALGVLIDAEPVGKLEQLAWMRGVAVAMARKAIIDPQTRARTYDDAHLAKRDAILARLDGFLPSDDNDINNEVIRLRVALNDPSVIQFALDLMNSGGNAAPPAWVALAAQNDRYGAAIKRMQDNPPPTFQLGIAFMLRNLTEGWTPTTRQAYFGWIKLALQAGGGNSYDRAVRRIRNQAVATLSEQDKLALGPLLDDPPKDLPPIVQPMGPGRTWTVAQATSLVEGRLKNRDFGRGVGLYQAALCAQCHRVGDLGGQIGPDLTTAGNKFSLADLMRATIEPSHEISDQYALSVVTLKDGTQVVGRLLDDNDAGVKVQPNVLSEETIDVPRDQIASVEAAPASAMPAGLVNPMSADELRDLTAYILSGGDPGNEMFKQ